MDTIRGDKSGPIVVVSKYSSSVAVTSKRLGREERSRGYVAEATSPAAVAAPAEALGSVLEDFALSVHNLPEGQKGPLQR